MITATTGLNHLDVDALKEAGIEVLSLKGQTSFLETITATAEHTMGLLLSLVRTIPAAHQSVLHGNWNRDLFKGHEIAGKVIGIVGYGRLGKIVASYCRAFRMTVMIYDPFVKVNDVSLRIVDTLKEVFNSADFITLHLPLNASTMGLVDRTVLSGMKPGSYLINTSRGEIVVEDHLLETLTHKKIAGAALDVLCDEEYFSVDNPLVQFAQHNENLLLTPHIGGCTWESMSKCEEFMAKKLADTIR
ncbi:MAG TPA: hydroxyacid dehydrogenase [Rikenellaceae bacterium]|nr:hydroxyacid dehydrogenase [Rikenellaceae bacterium]